MSVSQEHQQHVAPGCPGPADVETLAELTRLVSSRAREKRSKLRTLELESGISKTTWSAWSRGDRVIGRERLAEVVARYDPDDVQAWLAAWDRLAAVPSAFPPPPAERTPAGERTPVRERTSAGEQRPVGEEGPRDHRPPTAGAGRPTVRRRPGRPSWWTVVGAGVAGVAVGAWAASALIGPQAAAPAAAGSASPTPTSTSTGPITVTVDSPANGSGVRGCEIFTGVAALPQGTAVVLSMRNLTDQEPKFNLEPMSGWEDLSGPTWRGSQHFGSGNLSVGKFYEVRVLVMARDDIVRGRAAADAAGHNWHVPRLPTDAPALATLTYRRIAGPGPAECT